MYHTKEKNKKLREMNLVPVVVKKSIKTVVEY
jgi:hypothetical protein